MFTRKAVAAALGGTITARGTIRASLGQRVVEIDLRPDTRDGFAVLGFHTSDELELDYALVRERLWKLLDGPDAV